jgi:hypothetical protein
LADENFMTPVVEMKDCRTPETPSSNKWVVRTGIPRHASCVRTWRASGRLSAHP